jgi:hypothetical protein
VKISQGRAVAVGTLWAPAGRAIPSTVIILRRMGSALRYAEPVPRARRRAMRSEIPEFRQKTALCSCPSQRRLHFKYKHPSRLCT